MKKFAIFGYYGQKNAGDEAILAAFIKGIEANSKDHFISVYTDTPAETTAVHHVAAHLPTDFSVKGMLRGVLGRNRIRYLKSLLNFLGTDVVIIGGGSLFFDSAETNKWMLGYLHLIKLAKRLGKRVGLIGISVGPLHHSESKKLIGTIFPAADSISVRDQMSKNLLVECGITPESIQVIPDLVFTLSSANTAIIEEVLRKEDFCTNNRRIALAPCCYNTKFDGWHEQYAAFCEVAASVYDADLWVIPMQRNGALDDLIAFQPVIDRLSDKAKAKIKTLKGIYAADVVQGVIGQADFMLAERLHGSIMALNTGTPFMGISYMPKVEGVLRLANLETHVISMQDFLSGAFLTLANQQISTALTHAAIMPNRDAIELEARQNLDIVTRL